MGQLQQLLILAFHLVVALEHWLHNHNEAFDYDLKIALMH
jgi:hypothetical protein